MSFAVVVHLLCVVIWVGGMFFAWMVLRPAAATELEGPSRLKLWHHVFGIFFKWVWMAIVMILASGYWMVFSVFGGMGLIEIYIHIMQGLGLLMMLIFAHLYFAPYKRFCRFVEEQNFPRAAGQLAIIRRTVGINLLLGLCVIVVAAAGRYF